ncbi:MAG: PilZ domain-containing protein [Desulfamplus sp.]|nr:PilZ domain-containing protein [Desulfamplus sp.]
MPIENLLTKIIVNTNKLPYEKQQQLLQITQDWLAQAASGNKDTSPSINTEEPAKSKKIESTSSESQPTQPSSIVEAQPSQSESTENQEQTVHSAEPVPEVSAKQIPIKEDVVVNIIEERAYERKDLSIPIDFVSAGQLYKEVTKDLSAGGLFIKTKKHTKFKKNQKISMVFELSEDKKPFKLTGKIIRVESEGIAVQFHNISPFECVAIEEELSNSSE